MAVAMAVPQGLLSPANFVLQRGEQPARELLISDVKSIPHLQERVWRDRENRVLLLYEVLENERQRLLQGHAIGRQVPRVGENQTMADRPVAEQ